MVDGRWNPAPRSSAIERAQVLLTSRLDVQRFHIYRTVGERDLATSGFGHRLVGTVSRDRG
jgi:hypothetical protein